MKFAAVVDVAAFVWDENLFNHDQGKFYHIIETIPKILNVLIKEKVPVLLRTELLQEIQGAFPYHLVPNQYREFKSTTIRQLTKLNLIDYKAPIPCGVSASPPLSRGYFSASINSEIDNLLCYLYIDDERIQHLLTFHALWEGERHMTLKNGSSKIIETKICDNSDNHASIVNSLKKIFEHNPKHKRVESMVGGKVASRLRCYNIMVRDNVVAQKILDNAVYVEGFYYGRDETHSTYVKFMHTENNLYHGFEIKPSADLEAKIEKAKKNV